MFRLIKVKKVEFFRSDTVSQTPKWYKITTKWYQMTKKLYQKLQNCSKWLQNCLKWSWKTIKWSQRSPKWSQIVPNDFPYGLKLVLNVLKCFQMVLGGARWLPKYVKWLTGYKEIFRFSHFICVGLQGCGNIFCQQL